MENVLTIRIFNDDSILAGSSYDTIYTIKQMEDFDDVVAGVYY